MQGLDDTLSAIEAASFLGTASPPGAPVLQPGTPKGATVMSEAQAKAALSQHGLDVPRAVAVQRADETGVQAAQIGFPVVLKGMGVAHKTEAGLVALDLRSEGDVVAAAQAMTCDGFLVEEMAQGGVAELLIGVLRDPAHGFVLTLGAGGVMTEILADTVSLLLPVTEADVVHALAQLRIAPVLRGYRGRPGIDTKTVAQAVMAVQDYVTAEAGRIEEVEINPLICTTTRAIAADALIRIGEDK
jgi:succinyl-CoA synthetase beta subunit